jgi:leader peptidase (prepilin peptidase) / N-methyltransferase
VAFLDENPGLGFPAAAAFGLALGSFLNVVILRLPRRLEWQWRRDAHEILEDPEVYDPPPPGIVVEPSHCPHCKHKLSWFENIPLLSWLALRGKCRHCAAPISAQYPLVEFITMVLVLACVWQFGFGWRAFGGIVFTCFLVALAGIDLRTRLLPDQLTLPLLWLGLIASIENLYVGQKAALLGVMAGYFSLWSVYWVFKQLTGKEGMGHGDFKLLAAIGAWVGLNGILPTILISSIVGAIVGSVWLFAAGRDRATPIPFGPYLAIAGWIAFFWSQPLIDGYLHLAGVR